MPRNNGYSYTGSGTNSRVSFPSSQIIPDHIPG